MKTPGKLLAAHSFVDHPPTTNGSASVPLSGGTMTGPLILSGAPTVAAGAATKQYVDTKVPVTIPAPPAGAGPFHLQSVNGVLSWV